MSTVEQPKDPGLVVYSPEEAVKRAQPLPPREGLVIEDVSEAEWAAFREALAES